MAKRAFTLIEILVAVGIVAILSAVVSDIFINISRAHNKASIITEIERSGSTALSAMGNDIRNALSISPTSGSSSEIVITDQDKASITFSCVAPTGDANGYIARDGNPMTDNDWETGVDVTYCMFTVIDADPPAVKIKITIAQPGGVPARIDFQAQTTLETTVSLRTY